MLHPLNQLWLWLVIWNANQTWIFRIYVERNTIHVVLISCKLRVKSWLERHWLSGVLFSLCLNASLFGVRALTFLQEIEWQGKEWNGELWFHPCSLSRISFCLITEKIWGKLFQLRNLGVKMFGKVFGYWENLRESKTEVCLFKF